MNAKFVRENPDIIKNNQLKRFLDPTIVDAILNYDSVWKNSLYNYDQIEKNRKKVQKFIKICQNNTDDVSKQNEDLENKLIEYNNILDHINFIQNNSWNLPDEYGELTEYEKSKIVSKILSEPCNSDEILNLLKLYEISECNLKSILLILNKMKVSLLKVINDYNEIYFADILVLILEGKYNLDNLKTYSKNDIIALLSFMSKKSDECDKLVKINVIERDILVQSLGNILHESVPCEKDENLNPIIRAFEGYKPSSSKLEIHNDLCEKYNIINFSKGTDIAGERGYFWKHIGVKFNRALINYALDFLEKKNYSFIETPHFMQKEQMELVAQLSEFNETLYKLEGHNQYLIATSEQPITAFFANTKFKKTELPHRVCGLSTCYRKEVGSHGKDTRGIFRVHQFEKVEQFCITDKDTSWDIFHEMVHIAEEFYQSLGLSYRIVQIVSGGLNNAASMKYDLEAYFPGSNNYKELVSCSNCLDYFSKKIACKDEDKNYLHMLNGTLCANTRTICCILETYQTDEGIVVPDVLKPYLGEDILN